MRNTSKRWRFDRPGSQWYCAMLIRQYTDRLNRVDATRWSVKEVVEYLVKDDEDVCFSDYARIFIKKMEKDGHERNAKEL